MKELYTKPMADIEEFAAVDVLTTSMNPEETTGSEDHNGGWG